MTRFLSILALIASSSGFAATYTYDCHTNGNQGGDQTLEVSAKRVSLTPAKNNEYGMKFTADFDANYRPRKPGKVRFTGAESTGSREVVLSTEMLQGGMIMRGGSRGGFMQIRGDEDGYWSENWVCFARK